MKKFGLLAMFLGLAFSICENAWFGWNFFPKSNAEACCDFIAFALTSFGFFTNWKFVRRQAAVPMIELSAAIGAVDAEPEFPGTMPDGMWEAIASDKETASFLFQQAANHTKRNIATRLRNVADQ